MNATTLVTQGMDIKDIIEGISRGSLEDKIRLVSRCYTSLAPFFDDILPHLNGLSSTDEGCLCLAKLHFAVRDYGTAIRYLKKAKTAFNAEQMGSNDFFFRQMCRRMLDNAGECKDLFIDSLSGDDEDVLGYLLDIQEYDVLRRRMLSMKDAAVRMMGYDRTMASFALDFDVPISTNSGAISDVDMSLLYFQLDALVWKMDTARIIGILETATYPIDYRLAFYLFDNFPFVSRDLRTKKENVNRLLTGSFQRGAYLNFLAKNNKTDFNFLSVLTRSSNKYDSKVVSLLSNAIMNLWTTNDSLYRLNVDLLTSCKGWSKFVGTSVLGAIHAGNENAYEILQKYLPNENDLKRGGSLVALGFINKSECREEDTEFFTAFLMDDNLYGEIKYGAALGLGLCAMGSMRPNIVSMLIKQLNTQDLIGKEGVLVSLGLVNAGRAGGICPDTCKCRAKAPPSAPVFIKKGGTAALQNSGGSSCTLSECINLLFEICKGSEHDRECRSAGLGLAISLIGTEQMCEEMLTDESELVRLAGVWVMGTSFVGTCDLGVVERLLDLSSDCDENVRRCAVVSIGLVCCTDTKLLYEILEPLAMSHCPRVRGSVALTLGFFLCGSGDLKVSNIIEALLYDTDLLVVQQASLGMGLLLMQCNDNINPNFKRIVNKLNNLIVERMDGYAHKFGCVLGRALMECGGTNVVLSVLSSTNKVEISRVAGALLFFQYWFWYPYFLFINLCVKPTGLFAFDKNLEECEISMKVNDAKSKFDYKSIKIEEVKKGRRFKRRPETIVPAKEVVDEPNTYYIGNDCRMTTHEMKAVGKIDYRFEFL